MGLTSGDQSKKYLAQLVKSAINTAVCIGYESITVSTIQELTIPAEATYCEIAVESDLTVVALRYTMTSTVPTAAIGMPLSAVDRFDIANTENMRNFSVIQTGAGTHTLHIQYFK